LGVDRGFAWEESMVLPFKALFKEGSLLLKPQLGKDPPLNG